MNQITQDKDLHISLKAMATERNLQLLSDELMGFYLRLRCFIADSCFPYGFLSRLTSSGIKQAEKVSGLNAVPTTCGSVGPKQWESVIALNLPLQEQLKLVKDCTQFLPISLRRDPDKIAERLHQLQMAGLIGRTSSGILFDRAMVKDGQKRIASARRAAQRAKDKAAGKLSASAMSKTECPRCSGKEVVTTLPKEIQAQPVTNPAQGGQGKVSIRTEAVPQFDLREYYTGGYAEAKRRWYRLTEKQYESWHRFVSFLIQDFCYQDIFKAKMVEPLDFADIVDELGFTEGMWIAVVERILITGIKPHHKLYFRLKDFIGYVQEDRLREQQNALGS